MKTSNRLGLTPRFSLVHWRGGGVKEQRNRASFEQEDNTSSLGHVELVKCLRHSSGEVK